MQLWVDMRLSYIDLLFHRCRLHSHPSNYTAGRSKYSSRWHSGTWMASHRWCSLIKDMPMQDQRINPVFVFSLDNQAYQRNVLTQAVLGTFGCTHVIDMSIKLNGVKRRMHFFLTAQTELFIRVVPTVINTVTHPTLAHAQPVCALELVVRTPTAPWVTSSCKSWNSLSFLHIVNIKNVITLSLFTQRQF